MTSAQRVPFVVIDDDPLVATILAAILGDGVAAVETLAGLKSLLIKTRPRAIFLDLHLDQDDGLSAVPLLRARWQDTPILAITADYNATTVRDAFTRGVDDIIRKPLERAEILARLDARVAKIDEAQRLRVYRDIAIDNSYGFVTGPSGSVPASWRVRALLAHLAEARGQCVRRDRLRRALWNGEKIGANSLDQLVSITRRTLRACGSVLLIRSQYGRGLTIDDSSLAAAGAACATEARLGDFE